MTFIGPYLLFISNFQQLLMVDVESPTATPIQLIAQSQVHVDSNTKYVFSLDFKGNVYKVEVKSKQVWITSLQTEGLIFQSVLCLNAILTVIAFHPTEQYSMIYILDIASLKVKESHRIPKQGMSSITQSTRY